ncbi:oligopeptide transport system permease protein [Hydrogenispora ethanolica]|uniref:Oligopeptide transport system permease protein n=1 Tax=Hydrogenispora ethanolica TaxID=1082276 RepID=A0A4R1RQB9_HYDET|nr:ABC transporter permease [Hydrogenispora ethanolica]TCL68494.1 oligopeptide transport system permease protein [Hydrogenispora ethanolica]
MGKYILGRLGSAIVTLWIVITVTFFLMHAIPGGPFTSEKKLPPEVLENIEARYHLNDPLLKQYGDYLVNILKLDLGPSFKFQGRTVNDLIREGFPVSATIGIFAILLALGIGVPAGIFSALNHNKWQDSMLMLGAIIGVSIPSFVMATLLQFIFSFQLGWFPPALWGMPSQVVLPVVALSVFPMAFVARLTRSSMLEVLAQDYVRTARSKGLSEAMVIVRHVLKNALIPAIAVMGPLTATLLTGTFVIERIFAIPGLGRYYVNSIYNRDYTAILGVTVFYAAFVLLMSLIVDVIYAMIDPRIKLTGKGD